MPIYEYRCPKCNHVEEYMESHTRTGRHRCPKCGESRMERQISVFSCGGESRKSTDQGGSCPTGTCPFS